MTKESVIDLSEVGKLLKTTTASMSPSSEDGGLYESGKDQASTEEDT